MLERRMLAILQERLSSILARSRFPRSAADLTSGAGGAVVVAELGL
jgi:hypothetical protein